LPDVRGATSRRSRQGQWHSFRDYHPFGHLKADATVPMLPNNGMNGGIVFEAVIFAMIAAFLGFRLYAVLGKRTGHEQSLGKPAEDVIGGPKKADIIDDTRDVTKVARAVETDPTETGAVAGVRAIAAADPSFHAGEFVDGAEQAYQIILEAFWRGDEDTLDGLVSDDVLEEFAAAIAARKAVGQVLDNRLVRIERAVISAASLVGKVATISVRFDADIAAVTRDADGVVVAGSMSDAVPTHDAWTFERTIKSANPNWILVDTDEAA
jgi:predicted lipid-binding transport protein (Tim44 family)